MQRRALGITAVLCFATVAIVALRSWPDAPGLDRTGTVTVVGDSLSVGIEPYLADELRGWEITSDSVVGRRGEEGLAELRNRDAIASVLVISLGTNDPQTDVASFRRLVDDVMAVAGPDRCVVWSTIWRNGSNDPFNHVLRAAAARHENLELEDWAALVAERPGALASDGVHGTADGYAKRAKEIARIVEDCQPWPEPGP